MLSWEPPFSTPQRECNPSRQPPLPFPGNRSPFGGTVFQARRKLATRGPPHPSSASSPPLVEKGVWSLRNSGLHPSSTTCSPGSAGQVTRPRCTSVFPSEHRGRPSFDPLSNYHSMVPDAHRHPVSGHSSERARLCCPPPS